MRVGNWHILRPKSNASVASLVACILAAAMEIWNHECGPFWPNFAIFAIVCHIRTAIAPRGRGPSHREEAIIVAYYEGLNTIEFRVCSWSPYGVIQLLVGSMISPFAPHAAFCPICVVIPSVHSKQPV